MAVEVKVPQLGESVAEAIVANWMKKPGDAVAVDETICELETDKVTLEVNAPVAGALSEIVADTGAEVQVGAVLALIEEGDTIRIDADTRRIDSDIDWDARRAAHVPREPNRMGGVFDKFARLVSSAAYGATTIPPVTE